MLVLVGSLSSGMDIKCPWRLIKSIYEIPCCLRHYLSIGQPLLLRKAQQCILMSAATSSIRAMITLYVKKVVLFFRFSEREKPTWLCLKLGFNFLTIPFWVFKFITPTFKLFKINTIYNFDRAYNKACR